MSVSSQLTQISAEWKEDNRGIFKRYLRVNDDLRLRGEIYWAGAGRWVVTTHLERIGSSPGGQVSMKAESQLSRLPTKPFLLEAYYAAEEELVRQEGIVRLTGEGVVASR